MENEVTRNLATRGEQSFLPSIHHNASRRRASRSDSRRASALLVLVVCCMGCDACEDEDSGDIVQTRADPSTDFTSFHTYAFSAQAPAPDGGTTAIPEGVQANLESVDNAVRSELQELGMTEVPASANPDVFVVTLASTEDEQALTWSCVPGYWYGYWWGYTAWTWDPCPWLEPLYVEYEVGTVAVGLVEVGAQKVAFGGLLQGVLYDDGDVMKRIDDGVAEMFEDYPATQTGSAP